MSSEPKIINQLVTNIYAARDNDISCDRSAILMTRCADALYSEEESKREYPELWRHLKVCADCAEEYKAIMEIALLEAAGKLEETALPIHFIRKEGVPIWDLAKGAVTAFFAGFAPATAPSFRPVRGFQSNFKPIKTVMANGQLSVELEVKVNEENPQRLDLYCRLTTDDPALEDQFEGTVVWLQLSSMGTAIQVQTFDNLGDALFPAIEPDSYIVRWRLADQEYAIQDVKLPQIANI